MYGKVHRDGCPGNHREMASVRGYLQGCESRMGGISSGIVGRIKFSPSRDSGGVGDSSSDIGCHVHRERDGWIAGASVEHVGASASERVQNASPTCARN